MDEDNEESSGEDLEENIWKEDCPLFKACVKNDVGIAEEEIMRGHNLQYTDINGLTYLHIAVKHNSSDVVRLLLAQQNIRVNAKNVDKDTPLHFVKSMEILQQLITAGCDLNAINKNQEYPIIPLLENTRVDFKVKWSMLCVLMEHGADPYFPAHLPLLFSIIEAEYYSDTFTKEEVDELLSLFLVHGADVNQKFRHFVYDPTSDSPGYIQSLLMCTMNMGSNIAFEVIRYGANINFCNNIFSCLSLSVCYEDSQLFNYMWSNCDKSYIFYEDPSFLYSFLLGNRFGRYHFLESLYMILDSEFATDLIEGVPPSHLYDQLICNFRRLDIERDERVKVIYTLLTKSNRVSHDDLITVYKNYGYDKELEAFMVVTVNLSTYFDNLLTFLYYPDAKFRLKYSSKFQSLQELSRDVIRGCLKHVEGEAYFKYYNEIQRMNIPQRMKDIICLKIFVNIEGEPMIDWNPEDLTYFFNYN